MSELERKQPWGLTALGIACVLLGALWFLAGVWGLLQPDTLRKEVQWSRAPQLLEGALVQWAYADAAMQVLLAGLLFAAGVGLLRLRRWGARLGVWYAVARLAWCALELVFGLMTYARAKGLDLEKLRPEHARFMELRFGPPALTLAVAAVLLPAAFAVIVLCLLSRKTYKNALS